MSLPARAYGCAYADAIRPALRAKSQSFSAQRAGNSIDRKY
jgi:hypothetical protein